LGKPWNYPKDLSIDVRRRIGFLFQFPEHQFFAETVYDEVAFAAKNFELDSIEERVKKSLDIAGLSFDEFKDRSPFYPFRWRKEKSGVGFSHCLRPRSTHP